MKQSQVHARNVMTTLHTKVFTVSFQQILPTKLLTTRLQKIIKFKIIILIQQS